MLRLAACVLLATSCAASPSARNAVDVSSRSGPDSGFAPKQGPAHTPLARPADTELGRCDVGDRKACASLAARCHVGSTGDVKWESAACAERERRACNAGDPDYCRQLAGRYTDVTEDAGVPKDETVAAKLYERACIEGGGMDDCTEIANRYEAGRGVPKDLTRAARFLERSCVDDGGVSPPSCQRLADYLVAGTAVPKDDARAARLYVAACREGFCSEQGLQQLCADAGGQAKTNVGCVPLAAMLTMPVAGAPTNPGRARTLLERACQRRDAEACRALARWFAEGREWGDGTSTARDPVRARALLEQACAADPSGCKGP